jgi:NAD(P)-dependent dehydrogenase (short-subunit alcohol dehydrogenase family)
MTTTITRELAGRKVIVTGGAGALGRAVVEALLETGAVCHVLDRAPTAPDWLAGRESAHYQGDVDLANEVSVESLYESVSELWASIHLVGGFAMTPITEIRLGAFHAQMSLNAVTCFLCCREAVRIMRRGGRGGRIVNVAARPVIEPTGGMIAYTTAKAAVASLTQCLAQEVKGDRILVNAVVPSIIDTPANRSAMPDADHDAWPKPAELAHAIRYLASPENTVTSGTLLPLYGRA